MAELDAMRQEKLNNAAKVIQRGLRAFLQWREYIRLKRVAIRAQAKWRGQNPPSLLSPLSSLSSSSP